MKSFEERRWPWLCSGASFQNHNILFRLFFFNCSDRGSYEMKILTVNLNSPVEFSAYRQQQFKWLIKQLKSQNFTVISVKLSRQIWVFRPFFDMFVVSLQICKSFTEKRTTETVFQGTYGNKKPVKFVLWVSYVFNVKN